MKSKNGVALEKYGITFGLFLYGQTIHTIQAGWRDNQGLIPAYKGIFHPKRSHNAYKRMAKSTLSVPAKGSAHP